MCFNEYNFDQGKLIADHMLPNGRNDYGKLIADL